MNLHSELEVVNKDLALGLSSYYRMKELGWHDTPSPPFPISLSTKHLLKHCSLCCFCFVSESQPFTSSAGFRTIIFAVLTLQATCYFSLLRYSRTRPNKMYFASTAVFLAEVIKTLSYFGGNVFPAWKSERLWIISFQRFCQKPSGYT